MLIWAAQLSVNNSRQLQYREASQQWLSENSKNMQKDINSAQFLPHDHVTDETYFSRPSPTTTMR